MASVDGLDSFPSHSRSSRPPSPSPESDDELPASAHSIRASNIELASVIAKRVATDLLLNGTIEVTAYEERRPLLTEADIREIILLHTQSHSCRIEDTHFLFRSHGSWSKFSPPFSNTGTFSLMVERKEMENGRLSLRYHPHTIQGSALSTGSPRRLAQNTVQRPLFSWRSQMPEVRPTSVRTGRRGLSWVSRPLGRSGLRRRARNHARGN